MGYGLYLSIIGKGMDCNWNWRSEIGEKALQFLQKRQKSYHWRAR